MSINVQAGTFTPEHLRELFHRKTLAGELHRSGVARALKISETEATAISHLARHGQLTPGELGNFLGLTSGGTTALLHRLEGAGHVRRHPHPKDKRSIILTVSPETVERASEIYAPLVEEMDQIAGRYSDSERAMLGQYLTDIVLSAEGQAASLDSSTPTATCPKHTPQRPPAHPGPAPSTEPSSRPRGTLAGGVSVAATSTSSATRPTAGAWCRCPRLRAAQTP